MVEDNQETIKPTETKLIGDDLDTDIDQSDEAKQALEEGQDSQVTPSTNADPKLTTLSAPPESQSDSILAPVTAPTHGA